MDRLLNIFKSDPLIKDHLIMLIEIIVCWDLIPKTSIKYLALTDLNRRLIEMKILPEGFSMRSLVEEEDLKDMKNVKE